VPPPTTALIVGAPVNDAVARGGFNAYSASVIPGELYKISVTGLTDDIDLNVYDTDNTFTNPILCPIDNSSTVGIGNEDCIISASGNTLFFGVDGGFVAGSAAVYTIDIELLPLTNASLSLPFGDVTTRQSAGVYTVPVPAGTTHTVSITGLTDDVDLYVFIDDGAVIAPATCFPDNTLLIGTAPEDCTVTVSSGALFFVVDGIFSSAFTAQYTVLVTPTPSVPAPISEGSTAIPIGVLLDTPVTGQVGQGSTSFYAVSGLIPGTRYTVSITGLSGDANLTVFGNDTTFTVPATCLTGDNTSFIDTTAEDCTVALSGSSLFFTVTANTTSGGVAFINLVSPGP